MITLILGGVRSGKSELAERLAGTGGAVTYVATGPTGAGMQDRIAAHRDRRPAAWTTVEVTGSDLATMVGAAGGGTLLIDSLGTWVASHPDLDPDVDSLVAALDESGAEVVLVSDEVGLSVHPETEVGRRFQDALGTVNRRVSAIADRVLFVAAGRVIELGPTLETFE